jgi:hypothetical protein
MSPYTMGFQKYILGSLTCSKIKQLSLMENLKKETIQGHIDLGNISHVWGPKHAILVSKWRA